MHHANLMNDISQKLQQSVRAAYKERQLLKIVGGNTKAFYGRRSNGRTLQLSYHAGIVSYEPTELVITVRAGTLLNQVESVLAEYNQMLAFEPPYFGDGATIGGTIA